MDITTTTIEDITLLTLKGDLDGKTAPIAQEQIVSACRDGSKLILDMHNVKYMSSAGLRLMLLLQRTITSLGGQFVLVGLSDEIKDTMSATGFLAYLTTADTIEAGIAVLR